MPRLFSGLELPENARDAIRRLHTPLAGARWIEPENLHLTLRFVGDIEKRAAHEFADGLAAIDLDVFELRLSGLGVYGGNDPQVLWAGVEVSGPLMALARANERAARAAGLAPEGRAYKPHVTIARLRHTQPGEVARLLERLGAFRTHPFMVERFVLFSSRPHIGGGPYVIEDSFPLRGAPPEGIGDLEWA